MSRRIIRLEDHVVRSGDHLPFRIDNDCTKGPALALHNTFCCLLNGHIHEWASGTVSMDISDCVRKRANLAQAVFVVR